MPDQMPLAAPLATAISEKGYDTLTPVQEAMLAPDVSGRDLLVSAQTGSGKTVAFGLALADTLLTGDERMPPAGAPLALIIAPTRELALQVTKELTWLYAQAGAKLASCIGGMDFRTEHRALQRGVHIVVGTPGRLVDHIKRGSLQMDALRAVVLDEADEMLKMGFREELEEILEAAPQERRTLMFSATVSKQIARLAENYQKDALRLNTITHREQHVDIDYRAIQVGPKDVEKAVINLLLYHDAPTAIVFCARRDGVNKMAARLTNRGFPVVALSGEFSQKERSNSLLAMRDGRARVCVATDVAARGIDLPGLDLVIHADLPQNKEALLHRSGRTGRAGRKGASVLIVPGRARGRAMRLLKDAGVTASWENPPTTEDIQRALDERILSHPVLEEAVNETESALAEALLDKVDAGQLAAGFIRLVRAGQSSPEDLQDFTDEPPRRARRERSFDGGDTGFAPERRDNSRGPGGRSKRQPDFEDGAWISLGVGRSKNADPKWLVPMLCKAGGFSRSEIGVIEVGERRTFIELKPEAADRLMENAGEKQIIDKSLFVERASGPEPDEAPAAPHGGYEKRSPRSKPAPKSDWSPAPATDSPDDGDDPAPKKRAPRAKTGEPVAGWVKKPKKRKGGPKKPRGPNGEKKRSPGKKKPRG